MTKLRAFKNYVLVYGLRECETGFEVSIEKRGMMVSESSAYIVHGDGDELRTLLCRLWRCAVTPMSLACILEDEGYIPAASEPAASALHTPQS